MKRAALLLVLTAYASAHVVSMSTGVATVEGRILRYELRMPLYETQHMRDPENALFQHISFSSAGEQGRLVEKRCRAEQDSYVCDARYEFSAAVDKLDVTCTFSELGIPTHVHLLHATNSGNTAQAAFDASFTKSDLSFRPPTAAEEAARQLASGFSETFRSASVILLLLAIALSCRNWRDAAVLGCALLAGETAACLLLPFLSRQPALRFAEAAAALAAAYAAFEVLLSPGNLLKWWLILALGVLQGLRLRYFLASLDLRPAWTLAGAFVPEIGWLAILFALSRFVPQRGMAIRVLAGAILAGALAWFGLQL